jgi:hypothetical protein
MTGSNLLDAMNSGRETPDSAMQWLDQELTELLPAEERGHFLFKCNLWLLQQASRRT